MDFNLEKEISLINQEINNEKEQLNKLNKVFEQIPKNIINNLSKKTKDLKLNLNSLSNTNDIITKLDEIKEAANLNKKLNLLKSLLLSNKITSPYLKKIIITKLVSEIEIKNIEQSLLNIKYPMFDGKMLMASFEQLNISNKNDLELISLYLEIYIYLANDIYKGFDNYGTSNTIIKNNEKKDKFYFMEMISDLLFKKILSIFYYENKNNIQNPNEMPNYLKKLSNNEIKILFDYEKLISYLNKIISNTSELFSLLINKEKGDNENKENKEFILNKNIGLKNIMNNLFEKLIIYLISEKTPLDISSCSNLLKILLIQKTHEQASEFIKIYQYDSFKNIYLFDYIKYFINDNSSELIKTQKEFNSNIILKLKEKIQKEQDSQTYKTEDILDFITMILKDILSIYETFRTYTIIGELLIPSCNDILSIFKGYYEYEITYREKNLSLDSFFIINLIYNFLYICSNEFEIFLERINLFGKSVIDKISDAFYNFKENINELFKDFITFIIAKIKFDKILQLYEFENLQKGNIIEDINKAFIEENKFWFSIKLFLNKIKSNKNLYKYIEIDIVKRFVDILSKIVLKNIDTNDIEGKNLDILIDKTKFFIEDNFLSEENEINNENKESIQKLYSYLDNLFMNKKLN